MMKVQDGIESTFLVPIKMSLSRALATKLYFFLLGAPFHLLALPFGGGEEEAGGPAPEEPTDSRETEDR